MYVARRQDHVPRDLRNPRHRSRLSFTSAAIVASTIAAGTVSSGSSSSSRTAHHRLQGQSVASYDGAATAAKAACLPGCFLGTTHGLVRCTSQERSDSVRGHTAARQQAPLEHAELQLEPSSHELQLGALWEEIGVQPPWHARAMEVQRLPGRGYGWVARRPISKGELLMAVPAYVTLVAPMGDDSEVQLAASLLEETRGSAAAGGAMGDEEADQRASSARFWRRYTELHFVNVSRGAAFWDWEQIAELGWQPAMQQLGEYAQHIRAAVHEAASWANASLEDGQWAVGAVISRSFAVDDVARALVPFADLFNHEPQAPWRWAALLSEDPEQAPTPWSWSEDGRWFELRAPRHVELGEEVTIPYGEDTNAELLAVHGFVPRDSESDYVELFSSPDDLLSAFPISPESGSWELRTQAFEAADLWGMPLAIRPGDLSASAHLLSSLEAALATDDEFKEFHEQWSDDVGHRILVPGESVPAERRRELRSASVRAAAAAAQSALSQLPPSDDLDILTEVAPTALPSSEDLSAQFRLGVRRLLTGFVSRAAAWEAGGLDGL